MSERLGVRKMHPRALSGGDARRGGALCPGSELLAAEGLTGWTMTLRNCFMSNAQDALENDLDCQMSTPAESAIWHLYHAVAKHRLPSDCTGAEWWVQVETNALNETEKTHEPSAFKVYENGTGLAFHFDKDEDSYKSGQDMKHPCLSSILYLTGSDEDRLRQGKAHSCRIRE